MSLVGRIWTAFMRGRRRHYWNKNRQGGFTIVELLVVIVVIAIVAAITIVAYNGVQARSRASAMSAALSNTSKRLKLHQVDNDGNYPTDLISAGVEADDDTPLQYTVNNGANPKTFCVTASSGGFTQYINQTGTITAGRCANHFANIAPSFSSWTTSGGVVYNGKEARLTSGSGSIRSPLLKVDGATTTVRIIVNAYATQPSTLGTPNSRTHFSSGYYAADGTTPANNSAGYNSNGDAGCVITLSVWRSCAWTTNTGPNVQYIRFSLDSSTYTSDNVYKNIQVIPVP